MSRVSMATLNNQLQQNSDENKGTLVDLAKEVYKLNVAANKAKKKYDTACKELYAAMCQCGIKELVDEKQTISAKISAYVSESVNVDTLYKEIGEEQFLKIASVTKSAAEDALPNSLLIKHLVKNIGNENVTVKKL